MLLHGPTSSRGRPLDSKVSFSRFFAAHSNTDQIPYLSRHERNLENMPRPLCGYRTRACVDFTMPLTRMRYMCQAPRKRSAGIVCVCSHAPVTNSVFANPPPPPSQITTRHHPGARERRHAGRHAV